MYAVENLISMFDELILSRNRTCVLVIFEQFLFPQSYLGLPKSLAGSQLKLLICSEQFLFGNIINEA